MSHPHPTTMVQNLAQRYADKQDDTPVLTERIPVSHYTDQARFEREREQLLLKRPLVLGHETQIPNAGDAIVQDWLGLPIITVRDKGGSINSFLNVCRHRGMRLVQEQGQTCVRSFVCPYHQWTYGLDGALRNVPRNESFLDLDSTNLGLVSLPTAVRNGMIWLQPSPGSIMDIDKHLAGLDQDLDYFRLADYHYCQHSVREVPANWKLIQDAFLDGYHVVRLHKDTVGPFFPDGLTESDNIGDHIRSAVARNEITEAAGLAPEDMGDLRHYASFSYSTFPNAVLVLHPEYISIISLFPQAADKTIFMHSMLTPKAAINDKERDHFKRSFELIDAGVFAAEDLFVAKGAQLGMASGANDCLMFGGLEEAAIRFHGLIAREIDR